MWPFKVRADTSTGVEVETSEDALLRASLIDDYVTKSQAMNVPTFASCVNMIVDSISMIPIKLYRIKDGSVEAVDDRRVNLINKDTGDTLDGVQFKRALVRDYLIGKGGYAYINRKGNRVESLHYVQESEISFMFSNDPIFKDYDVMIQGVKYRPFDFLKLLRNTDNGRSGKSIVEENCELVSVAYHSLKFEKNLVKTGGNKKGFIKSPRKLAQAAMDALKAAWRNLYQNNTENVVVLNEGLEFQESSNTSVEMQLNENKRTNAEEICKIFNMPMPMIMGGATEEDKSNYVEYCLNPILTALECALNRDLLLEKEKETYYFSADTSELTKGDIVKRFQAFEIASRSGFLQIDEIRAKENMAPLGLNFVRLGLQDVFYDPASRTFYTPNMGMTGSINPVEINPGVGGEDDEN